MPNSREKKYISKQTGRSDTGLFLRLWKYAKKQRSAIVFSVSMLLLTNAVNVVHPYVLKVGIDEGLENSDIRILVYASIVLVIMLIVGFFVNVLLNYSIQKLGQKLIKSIRIDLTKKLLTLPKSYFDKTPTGKLLTLLTNDVESIRAFLANGVVSIFGDLITIIFIVSIMLYISPLFTGMVLVTVPAFAIATYAFKVSLRKGYRGVRRSNSVMNTLLVESITGIREILLFNHRKNSIDSFDKANKDYRQSFISIVKSYSLYFPLIEAVSSLSMIGILFASHFIFGKTATIGDIFAFFIYINMLFRPLRDLAEQFNTLQSAMSGGERIFDFFDEELDNLESLDLSRKKQPVSSQKAELLDGAIEFQKVSFQYKKGEPVLRNISFRIEKGEKVAIVGSTGAGKSTITSLLTRLYKPNKGKILIGGQDIQKVSLEHVRKSIALIPQNVFLFTGNFFDNIQLTEDKSLETIKTAAKQALINQEIEKRKDSYDSNVLEEGKSLSTGQKQLLSFARAFLKDCPTVILDEATASIDTKTEKKIEKALGKLLQNRSAIIIAHRLSTISMADRIIVMHRGRIVEQGTQKQLLRIPDGVYRKLHSMQSIQLQSK